VTDEQQQQAIRTTPYQSPMYNYGSSIVMLTNPEDELNQMELTFRSLIVDKDGNTKNLKEPLLNDLGINSVMGQVRAIVSKHSIMGNFDRDIPMLIDFLADTLARDLMVNRFDYEIRNVASRDRIYFVSLTTAYIVMKRGYKEGDKRFWKGSTQEITTRVDGQQKQGLLSRALGWGQK
jgi:hypothetical protein